MVKIPFWLIKTKNKQKKVPMTISSKGGGGGVHTLVVGPLKRYFICGFPYLNKIPGSWRYGVMSV